MMKLKSVMFLVPSEGHLVLSVIHCFCVIVEFL